MSAAPRPYAPILHVYPNGDWLVERPYYTGSDFGPGHYGKKPPGCDADTQIAFYIKPGGEFVLDDQRAKVPA